LIKGSFFEGEEWFFSWSKVVDILEEEFCEDGIEQMSFDFG
jgi:hypothetical protein